MIELKAEDLHISLYSSKKSGDWNTSDHDVGVRLIHLPTGIKVSCEKYKSSHKNKQSCMTVLQDILTPFKEGDIVWDGVRFKELIRVDYRYQVALFGEGAGCPISNVSHTKEGYVYKRVTALKECLRSLEEEHIDCKQALLEEIKTLEGMV